MTFLTIELNTQLGQLDCVFFWSSGSVRLLLCFRWAPSAARAAVPLGTSEWSIKSALTYHIEQQCYRFRGCCLAQVVSTDSHSCYLLNLHFNSWKISIFWYQFCVKMGFNFFFPSKSLPIYLPFQQQKKWERREEAGLKTPTYSKYILKKLLYLKVETEAHYTFLFPLTMDLSLV